ncbi:MAG: hypothetical protein ACYTGN_18160 [Planctomycetota bacterium]|jgi:hypothetical protein
MRSTASLVLLVAACANTGRQSPVRNHPLDRGRAYSAVHELVFRRKSTTVDTTTVEREVERIESYRDTMLTAERAQRLYDVYDVVERTTIEGDTETTPLDQPVVGEPIVLVKNGEAWEADPATPADLQAAVGARTFAGPPRFWEGESRGWRTFRDIGVLHFCGLGALKKGTVRARMVQCGEFAGAPTARIAIDVDETYEHGTVRGRGYMTFDIDWGMVGKLVVSGEIRREGELREKFTATLSWSPYVGN